MIHISLPMRPRVQTIPFQGIVTPLSIVSQNSGTKIITATSIKTSRAADTPDYFNFIRDKVGSFDFCYSDADINVLGFVSKMIPFLPIQIRRNEAVKSCPCGEFEEFTEARMFNQRKTKQGVCVLCNGVIERRNDDCVVFTADWTKVSIAGTNHSWINSDLEHFLKRQVSVYLFSKRSARLRFVMEGKDCGIRYQYVWALLMGYLAKEHSDNKLTLHYVNLIQDKVFFIVSLAQMIFPNLEISLHALPRVNTVETIPIEKTDILLVNKLRNVLSTKRKEISIQV